MAFLRRTFVLLTLVIQAAFGPAGLPLDVCHGKLQWAAPSGESCCGPSHTAPQEQPTPPTCGCDHDHGGTPLNEVASVEDEACSACFQIALEGTEEAFDTWGSDELISPVFRYVVCAAAEVAPACLARIQKGSRAPPGAVPRTGLLPGTFPLRI